VSAIADGPEWFAADLPWAGLALLAVSGACWLLLLRVRRKPRWQGNEAVVAGAAAARAPGWHPKLEELLQFTATLFVPMASIAAVLVFVARVHYVPSQSMLPGLPDGSLVLALRYELGFAASTDRRVLMLRPLRRGDVAVFRYPLDPRVLYVKRVIGLPGDTVRYDISKGFTLSGQKFTSKYLGMFLFPETGLYYPRYQETLDGTSYEVETYDEVNRPKQIETLPGRRNAEACVYAETWVLCVLPAGQYFMAGDNRDRSEDSRAWGLVPEGLLIGRVVATPW
jgi:signal peptidase I